jgi:hypothetical protein
LHDSPKTPEWVALVTSIVQWRLNSVLKLTSSELVTLEKSLNESASGHAMPLTPASAPLSQQAEAGKFAIGRQAALEMVSQEKAPVGIGPVAADLWSAYLMGDDAGAQLRTQIATEDRFAQGPADDAPSTWLELDPADVFGGMISLSLGQRDKNLSDTHLAGESSRRERPSANENAIDAIRHETQMLTIDTCTMPIPVGMIPLEFTPSIAQSNSRVGDQLIVGNASPIAALQIFLRNETLPQQPESTEQVSLVKIEESRPNYLVSYLVGFGSVLWACLSRRKNREPERENFHSKGAQQE